MSTELRDGSRAKLSDWIPWHRRRQYAAAVRLCVAVDIERFSRFTTVQAGRAQQRLLWVVRRARQQAGIREGHVVLQQAGDGQLAILPPALDGAAVIPQLQEGIWAALRDINSELSDHARIRLRVALYQGHVSPGDNGWVGHATTAVHRLLDSTPAREALRAQPSADFVLIVGADIYRDYLLDHPSRIGPDVFHRVEVDIPAKDFAEPAWMYLPASRQ
ncbi:hypothetical protein [Actinocrispum wychmicini]|uniref:Guanylate cyclase domain-containing protein n=1 Tax=Actinocrispum wychmicini TaxID=1213861 RepID=A0A4R2JC99_9PSEU|nr:hypothetical protein [Actinocrispum wychmicini]TCO55622.1 hypothetical protein EV192_10743 [Actinocrispum wychmicini]